MNEPKPYLSIAELAQQIPYTEQSIRGMMRKGDLLEGTHFFRRGRRVVFKWAAICEWIEGTAETLIEVPRDIAPLRVAGGSR